MSEAPNTVSALIRKRAEIAGQIEHAQTTLRQLIIDLDNLDHTIRLFRPDIDLEEIRPKPLPPRNQAFRGEVSRLILGALRQSRAPLTTQDLARHVMAEQGLNTADKRQVRTVGKRVGSSKRHLRSRGLVRSERGSGQCSIWTIAQQK
jgi:hypothetical protein